MTKLEETGQGAHKNWNFWYVLNHPRFLELIVVGALRTPIFYAPVRRMDCRKLMKTDPKDKLTQAYCAADVTLGELLMMGRN